jgi:hypothetical protein
MTLLQQHSSSNYTSHPHGHSHVSNQGSQHPHRPTSSSKRTPTRPALKRINSAAKQKRVSIAEDPSDLSEFLDGPEMSFPQFCTVCEKQIGNPCSSILYCSERCRRSDTNKPLETPRAESPPSTPKHSHHSDDSIVPRKSPTLLSSNRFSYTSLSSAASFNDAEYDSAEPAMSSTAPTSGYQPRPAHRRHDSEAARYLRLFHSNPQLLAEQSSRSSRRPKPASRASTTSISMRTPSLSHSDASTTASPGTSPTMSNLTGVSLPYTYSRPLPPRTNPMYSSSYGASKSISLVTPGMNDGMASSPEIHHGIGMASASLPGFKARASISTDVGAELLPSSTPVEDVTFEKKAVIGSPDSSTLRSLFRFSEMQAPPTA